MDIDKLKKTYLPMTETAYCIMLSLIEKRHGYGVMQHVETLTKGRIKLGAGTLYGSLSRMEKDKLIEAAGGEERRKLYELTELGRVLLKLEVLRLKELYELGMRVEEEIK